jgi:hypothetical protein
MKKNKSNIKTISLAKVFKNAFNYLASEEDIDTIGYYKVVADGYYKVAADGYDKFIYSCVAIEQAIYLEEDIDYDLKKKLLKFVENYLDKCGLDSREVGFHVTEYGPSKAQRNREIWMDFLIHSAKSSDVRFKFKQEELFKDVPY